MSMNKEQLIVREQDGVLTLDGERIVLTSAAVFGTLREDITENLGTKRTKGFLNRYGWNLGAADAYKTLRKPFPSIKKVLRQGAQLHMLKGYAKARTRSLQLVQATDGAVKSVHVTGVWHNSYEAEEYIRLYGETSEPVCHTLTGYASGFYSTVCEKTIIFKEIACRAAGDSECHYIGKSVDEWMGEADEERQHYESNVIIKELEKTYEQLLEERNNLTKVAVLQKKMSEEIIKGNNLASIADVIFKTVDRPIVIEDVNFETIASAGFTDDNLEEIKQDFQRHMKEQGPFQLNKTIEIYAGEHCRVMTPIVLQNKVFGYCSFIYTSSEAHIQEIDTMILERAATVCSLYLLNEKSSFEAEERVKGYFLDQVLSGQFTTVKEVLKRGGYFQLDLRLPYYIVVLKHASTENELYFNEKIMEEAAHYFKNRTPGLLAGQSGGSTILLVQQTLAFEDGGIKALCKKFKQHIEKAYPNIPVRIAISTEGTDIGQARQCFEEALTTLKIGDRGSSIVSFDDLGIIGILVHTQNQEAVEQKAHHLLHPLFEGNQIKELELLQTMYVFLLNGGNLEKTMVDLSISMSGLRYRIEKIERMLNKNLRDPETSFELTFILKALIASGKLTL